MQMLSEGGAKYFQTYLQTAIAYHMQMISHSCDRHSTFTEVSLPTV